MHTKKTILENKAEALRTLAKLDADAQDRPMTADEDKQWRAASDAVVKWNAEEVKHADSIILRTAEINGTDRQNVLPYDTVTRENRSTPLADLVHATLNIGEKRDGINSSNGAAAIETDNIRNEIIHQLQATNPLRKLGARFVNMVNHSVFPTVGGIGYSHFVEGETLTINDGPVISSRNINFKTAAVLVLISKLFLHDAGERGRQMINRTVIDAMNNAIINSVFHGNAADKEPNGLDNISGVVTIDAAGAAVTNYALHLDAVAALAANNVDVSKVGYVQGTRTWRQTAGLVDANGQPLMQPRAIADLTHAHTTAVKEDYGTGSDQTRMYFGDFSNLVIGMGGTFRMELAERYADTMQTGFLAYMRYDVQALRPDNFCIVENLATN